MSQLLPLACPTAPNPARPPSKNRVGGSPRSSALRAPKTRSQLPESHRVSRPDATITASGRPVWPSRDPIGERGGVNFYILLNNRVATYVDILGREAYPGLGPIPPISGGVWNPIQDYVDGEVDDSDANPHEKEWARVHLCCGKVATKMNGKLKRAFVEAGYNNKGAPGVWNDGLEDLDGTSVNAVLHCALTCAMASSIWCSKEDVAGFGVAHETGNQQNSLKDMTMDLYNNAVGLELSENGQTISECIRKCEQAAHNDRLRWYNKLEPWALNPDGLAIEPNYNPDDYANFWPPTEDELNNQQSVLAS